MLCAAVSQMWEFSVCHRLVHTMTDKKKKNGISNRFCPSFDLHPFKFATIRLAEGYPVGSAVGVVFHLVVYARLWRTG